MISIFRKDEGSSITYLRCIIKMRRPASARGSSSTKWKQNVWKHQEKQRPKFHGMKLVSMINFESASWIMQSGNAQTRSTPTTTIQRNHHPISIISQTAKRKKHPKAKKCHHFSTKKMHVKKNIHLTIPILFGISASQLLAPPWHPKASSTVGAVRF